MPTYPAYPARRFGYEADGSTVATIDASNVITDLTTEESARLNNEGEDFITLTGADSRIVVIFADLRDISHLFIAAATSGLDPTIETSTDTSDGVNGTWTTVAPDPMTMALTVSPNYREDIITLGVLQNAVRAIRLTKTSAGSHNVTAFHLFGSVDAGESPDMLALWSPASDVPLALSTLDLGDVARNQMIEIPFRVKNLSTAKTAENVLVSATAPSDPTPSMLGQLTFIFGGDEGSVLNIGTLGTGDVSGVVTLRYDADPAAQAGPWAFRVVSSPVAWA